MRKLSRTEYKEDIERELARCRRTSVEIHHRTGRWSTLTDGEAGNCQNQILGRLNRLGRELLKIKDKHEELVAEHHREESLPGDL